MKIINISNTTTAYEFDELESYITYAFLIERPHTFYIIDTFCGTESMIAILDKISNCPEQKKIVVINTHFHWDHVWGNVSFKGQDIVAHENCRRLLEEQWEAQLTKNRRYIAGTTECCLPNITFSERLAFPEDGLELVYTPGHTQDCITIVDHFEKILYVGDNVERPIIYVENKDVETYKRTLALYLQYPDYQIIASHTFDIDSADIEKILNYLTALVAGEELTFSTGYERRIHEQNKSVLRD